MATVFQFLLHFVVTIGNGKTCLGYDSARQCGDHVLNEGPEWQLFSYLMQGGEAHARYAGGLKMFSYTGSQSQLLS